MRVGNRMEPRDQAERPYSFMDHDGVAPLKNFVRFIRTS